MLFTMENAVKQGWFYIFSLRQNLKQSAINFEGYTVNRMVYSTKGQNEMPTGAV